MYQVIGRLPVTLTALAARASLDKTKSLLATALAQRHPDHDGGVTHRTAGNDIPVPDCFALRAPPGARAVASDPAASEHGLKVSRVQRVLR